MRERKKKGGGEEKITFCSIYGSGAKVRGEGGGGGERSGRSISIKRSKLTNLATIRAHTWRNLSSTPARILLKPRIDIKIFYSMLLWMVDDQGVEVDVFRLNGQNPIIPVASEVKADVKQVSAPIMSALKRAIDDRMYCLPWLWMAYPRGGEVFRLRLRSTNPYIFGHQGPRK